jgi:hypothetical protein
LVGPALAKGMALGDTTDTTVALQCGFKGLYEVLYKLVDEVERFGRLADLQYKLRAVLKRICEAAAVPTDRILSPSPGGFFASAARTFLAAVGLGTPDVQEAQAEIDEKTSRARATLGLSWRIPEWCSFLLSDLTPRSQVIPPLLLQPYSTRKHDQLKAVGVLMRRNPSLEPEKWSCFSKWWTRELRVQALCFADEQVEKFRLPDLRIIWPQDPRHEYHPPDFGLRVKRLDRQRQKNARLRYSMSYTGGRPAKYGDPSQSPALRESGPASGSEGSGRSDTSSTDSSSGSIESSSPSSSPMSPSPPGPSAPSSPTTFARRRQGSIYSRSVSASLLTLGSPKPPPPPSPPYVSVFERFPRL